MITKTELDIMNSEYSELFKKHGDNEKTLGWNKPKQSIRFEIILKLIQLKYKPNADEKLKLIDVGCGLAHFYVFLKEKNFPVEYTGVDTNQNFTEYCRSKHSNATFYNEIVTNNFHNSDIICASGVFNRRFDNSVKIIQDFILNAQKSTAKVIIINFLHSTALTKYPTNFYTSLCAVESAIDRNLVNGFEIDGLSLPGEFTIGLYK